MADDTTPVGFDQGVDELLAALGGEEETQGESTDAEARDEEVNDDDEGRDDDGKEADEEDVEGSDGDEEDDDEGDIEGTDDDEGNGVEDAEALELDSVSDLIEASGLSEEKILGLKMQVKVNGEEQEVPLSDLRNGYMRQDDYTRKTQAVSERNKKLNTDAEQFTQETTRQATVSAAQLNAVDQLLDSLYSKEELARLKEEDSSRYVIVSNDLREKKEQLQSIRNVAAQQYEQDMQSYEETYLKRQVEALAENGITMDDRTVIESAAKTLSDRGFVNTGEYLKPTDARIITLAHEYNQLLAENSKLKSVADKGRELAKRLKKTKPKLNLHRPGKGTEAPLKATRGKDRKTKVSKSQRKLAQTGSIEDGISIFESMME